MIPRDQYLSILKSFKDKQLIKVVTGIRRCGKSTLLQLYRDWLITQSVKENQIISINLEDPQYSDFKDYMSLYNYINDRLCPGKKTYVFIDEVQSVPSFQKACDGLFINSNVDLYITGSNAYLLSGELATLLSGRYVEIKMLPLSFKEYVCSTNEQNDLQRKYRNYIENSSFPYATELSGKKEIQIYLEGIYNSVVLKDIISRKKILDVPLLENIIRFMFDNIGNPVSATKISNFLSHNGNRASVNTVEVYLQALCDSFILYKTQRYDIKGKQHLSTGGKYYVVDIGLRYYLLGTKKADRGHILENIVYLELLRRGYEVHVGKVGDCEVDFIGINEQGEEYYQVAYSVQDDAVLERELKPLAAISDHNPKYLLVMDDEPIISHNGIKQINVLDWLMK